MQINNIEVFGFKNAMLGMRYPKNSEHLSDSSEKDIGPKDLELLLKLTQAGKDHRKALRMIHVQAAVDMPISWWIQYDTYKIGTTANSRSRMHKMGTQLLTKDDFYIETWDTYNEEMLEHCNKLIKKWQETKDHIIWKKIIDCLPMSYQQERMIDLNYEVLVAILNSRYNEKLRGEWRFFCDTFLNECLYLKEIWEVSK